MIESVSWSSGRVTIERRCLMEKAVVRKKGYKNVGIYFHPPMRSVLDSYIVLRAAAICRRLGWRRAILQNWFGDITLVNFDQHREEEKGIFINSMPTIGAL
jgi:hypothetical protein